MWGHRVALDTAWNLLKSDFGYQGRRGPQEEIMALANETLSRYDDWSAGRGKKPSFEVKHPSARSKKPMKHMELAGQEGGKYPTQQAALLDKVPGFTEPERGGIPQFINWWGGKSGLGNIFRELYHPLRHTHTPAELFGGSGSMLLGLNAGKGVYGEMNPDLTNAMRMVQQGLQVPDFGPNDKQSLANITDRANELRFRRDILGEDLPPHEEMELAQLFISANSRAFQGNMGYKRDDEWDSGPGRMKPGLRTVRPDRGSPAIPMDLRPWSDRMKNWEIHEAPMQEVAPLLDENHFLYLDPPYVGRQFDYSDNPLEAGRVMDDLQHETVRIGGEHDGPVMYSNYLTDPDTGEVHQELVDALMEHDYNIHPWPRNIKTGKKGGKNVMELLATRNLNWDGLKEKLPKMDKRQMDLLDW